jgi:hypothetical protein
MDHALYEWDCRQCGRPNKNMAAYGAVRCAFCSDTPVSAGRLARRGDDPDAGTPTALAAGTDSSASSFPMVAGDTEKRRIVARLRDRYSRARKLVSPAEPYGNLEWILGVRRDPSRDAISVDLSIAELVVLWLQDLAMELDRRILPETAGDASATGDSAHGAAAHDLRVATSDFASAFLGMPRVSSWA